MGIHGFSYRFDAVTPSGGDYSLFVFYFSSLSKGVVYRVD